MSDYLVVSNGVDRLVVTELSDFLWQEGYIEIKRLASSEVTGEVLTQVQLDKEYIQYMKDNFESF